MLAGQPGVKAESSDMRSFFPTQDTPWPWGIKGEAAHQQTPEKRPAPNVLALTHNILQLLYIIAPTARGWQNPGEAETTEIRAICCSELSKLQQELLFIPQMTNNYLP